MEYRTFGKTDIRISEVGFGAWGIGGKQWLGASDNESLKALHRAFELGVNFVDTALAYGDGHSEQLVGKSLAGAPGRIYVASKIPPKNRQWPAKPGVPIGDVFPYDYIIESTEQSLRNLGLECLDLQQLHVWTPEFLERDEWKRAFEDLKKAGKVRYTGVSLSEHDPDSGLGLVASGLVNSVQVIYNIFDQVPEQSLFPLCAKHNVAVLARCPFDEGSLTGSVSVDSVFEAEEFRAFYFRGDRKRQVVEHVDALKSDLSGVEGSLAEIALRFTLSHPAVASVIPGMRRVVNVERNCIVPGKGALPEAVLAKLKRHAWNKNFYE
jgi:aryl-alcohol dehydrogenase-like predicted oxidoreductase